MCYIDGQKNNYSVLNECNRMLKYNTIYQKYYYGSSIQKRKTKPADGPESVDTNQ
jgi:hypothetical protein